MQRGLSAAYDYSDFIYVVDQHDKLASLDTDAFKQDLETLIWETYPKNFKATKSDLKKLSSEQLLITAFDINFWNTISQNKVDSYTPAWNLPEGERKTNVHNDFPNKKKEFYKFNIKILFQVKKV